VLLCDDEFPADEDVDFDQLQPQVMLPSDVYNRPHGGIPFLYVFGDTNQLPAVMKKAVYSTDTPVASTSDAVGKIAFHDDFLDPPDSDVVEAYIVVMDEVLRQNDRDFLRLLDHMREGAMNEDDVELLFSRHIDQLEQQEKELFNRESLHLVPTWKAATEIIFNYLQHTLTAPIAKFTANYSSARSDGKNCCVRECRYPQQNALCAGAKVMLLKNFVVELGLMNGAVGTVKHLCYMHANGPHPNQDEYDHGDYDNQLQYAIVEFPDCQIPENSKFFDDLPRTYIPIPIVEERCEKKCCSVRALPLRCCKALSIHKSQGMTVGPGKPFQYITVHYPTKNTGARSTPGLELVATSRVESLNYLAVGNRMEDLSKQQLTSIGTTKAYDARKAYLRDIKDRAQRSKEVLMAKITSADPNPNENERSFEGGCQFLLEWYNSITAADNSD